MWAEQNKVTLQQIRERDYSYFTGRHDVKKLYSLSHEAEIIFVPDVADVALSMRTTEFVDIAQYILSKGYQMEEGDKGLLQHALADALDTLKIERKGKNEETSRD